MDDLEQKLASVMNDPALMEQIIALSKSFQKEEPNVSESNTDMPDGFDPKILQQLSGLAKQSSVDKNQIALLHALQPYLKDNRIRRLERAMKAAKMAGFATSLLGR